MTAVHVQSFKESSSVVVTKLLAENEELTMKFNELVRGR